MSAQGAGERSQPNSALSCWSPIVFALTPAIQPQADLEKSGANSAYLGKHAGSNLGVNALQGCRR